MTISSRLTIFEGCDGTGKTTSAMAYAKATDAIYVHFPAMNRVGPGLPRMYVEAMLPALLGLRDVVFDRCWMSEVPYGQVFREGLDRIGEINVRILERLAFRCGTIIVRCDPGIELVRKSFNARKGIEMLDSISQIEDVYRLYGTIKSGLPMISFDYKRSSIDDLLKDAEYLRTEAHPVNWASAGNLLARVCVVGDKFVERKDCDAFYQWPFGSFSKSGCSHWIVSQMMANKIQENQLFWIDADKDLSMMSQLVRATNIVALGDYASKRLSSMNMRHTRVEHPQFHKRFDSNNRYPLFDIIKKAYE